MLCSQRSGEGVWQKMPLFNLCHSLSKDCKHQRGLEKDPEIQRLSCPMKEDVGSEKENLRHPCLDAGVGQTL